MPPSHRENKMLIEVLSRMGDSCCFYCQSGQYIERGNDLCVTAEMDMYTLYQPVVGAFGGFLCAPIDW